MWKVRVAIILRNDRIFQLSEVTNCQRKQVVWGNELSEETSCLRKQVVWGNELSEVANCLRKRAVWGNELSKETNCLRKRVVWGNDLSEEANYLRIRVEVKDTTDTQKSASEPDLEIDKGGRLKTKLYDKRDEFTFAIVNFLFININNPAAQA